MLSVEDNIKKIVVYKRWPKRMRKKESKNYVGRRRESWE